jgi:hypothetical protein
MPPGGNPLIGPGGDGQNPKEPRPRQIKPVQLLGFM